MEVLGEEVLSRFIIYHLVLEPNQDWLVSFERGMNYMYEFIVWLKEKGIGEL